MNALQEIASAPLIQLSKNTKELIGKSLAPNTLKTYQRAIRKLVEWFGDCTLSEPVFIDYLIHLANTRKSTATIKSFIVAIKWAAKMNVIDLHIINAPDTRRILAEICLLYQCGG